MLSLELRRPSAAFREALAACRRRGGIGSHPKKEALLPLLREAATRIGLDAGWYLDAEAGAEEGKEEGEAVEAAPSAELKESARASAARAPPERGPASPSPGPQILAPARTFVAPAPPQGPVAEGESILSSDGKEITPSLASRIMARRSPALAHRRP
eukprot:tig00000540_g1936.t1